MQHKRPTSVSPLGRRVVILTLYPLAAVLLSPPPAMQQLQQPQQPKQQLLLQPVRIYKCEHAEEANQTDCKQADDLGISASGY